METPASSPRKWSPKVVVAVTFAVSVIALMIAVRAVIAPFLFGILLAYVLAPLVDGLSSIIIGRRPIPRGASVVAVYVGIASVIGIFLTAFLPLLSTDFARLIREAPPFFQRVKNVYIPAADTWLEHAFPQSAPVVTDDKPTQKILATPRPDGKLEIDLNGLEFEVQPQARGRYTIAPSTGEGRRTTVADLMGRALNATESELKNVLQVGQRFLRGVTKGVAWFVLTFMVAAYLLVDLKRVASFFRSLCPEESRVEYQQIEKKLDEGLSGVIRGQLVICGVNALLTTAGLLIFSVKYSILLGLVAGVMSFIPVFGSILSSVPIVAIALLSGAEGIALSKGFAVLGWIIAIHLLEANLFNPNIIGTAAKMHPVVVVFALLVGEETGGLAGAVLAVPVASMVQVLFLHFLRRERAAEVAS